MRSVKNMWTRLRKHLVLYPFLFAIFPILTLYTNNIQEVAFDAVVRSLVFSLIGTVVLLSLCFLLLRDLTKAGAITTFILVLFFTYGHVYMFLKDNLGLDASIVRHRYLVIIYAGIFVLGTLIIYRTMKTSSQISKGLNLLGVAILVFPMIQIINYNSKVSQDIEIAAYLIPNSDSLTVQSEDDLPDIYYMILDTYTRADAMEKELGYDNSEFLERMEQMGFYIAECSRSNYANTGESLAASLNMNYVSDLKQSLIQQGLGDNDLWLLIRHSLVRELLEGIGYKTVAFDTGYEWSRLKDADIYLTPDSAPTQAQFIEPFELMQFETTAGLLLTDYWIKSSVSHRQVIFQEVNSVRFIHGDFIRRELFLLDTLPAVASYPGPKFVFAHILIPHVPRVFGPEGQILTDPGYYSGELAGAIDSEYDLRGYLNEIQFINSEILKISEEIISRSKTPPIIIIQGDTGKSGQNIFEILNLYYTRGETNNALYPSISPVNTFRAILNSYFGAEFDFLPDESWINGDLIFERWAACKES